MNYEKRGIMPDGSFCLYKYVLDSMYPMVCDIHCTPSQIGHILFNQGKKLLADKGYYTIKNHFPSVKCLTKSDLATYLCNHIFLDGCYGRQTNTDYYISHNKSGELLIFDIIGFVNWVSTFHDNDFESFLSNEKKRLEVFCEDNKHLSWLKDVTQEPSADVGHMTSDM